jgi:hypothetical protein
MFRKESAFDDLRTPSIPCELLWKTILCYFVAANRGSIRAIQQIIGIFGRQRLSSRSESYTSTSNLFEISAR